MPDRTEYLDGPPGEDGLPSKYSEKMYTQLIAEVRAFVVEEFEERAALMEEGGLSRFEAERAAVSWSAWGKMPPTSEVPL